MFSLVSCGNTSPSSSEAGSSENSASQNISESSSDGTCSTEYKITLTAIGSTTINVSKTVQIRSSVTGTTEKDVSWSSSDETVATVSSTGLVTGVGAGEVNIKAALVIEDCVYKTIKITVEEAQKPIALAFTDPGDEIQWVGESKDLEISVTPEDASGFVTWASSDIGVASVTDAGHVEFLKEGATTITATSVEDATVSASVTYQVKEAFFRSDLGSPYWEVDHQSDSENPYVELPTTIENGYHSLYLSHVKAQKYYVEASFKITQIQSTWVWQGIGLGNGLSESDTRYFEFSPRVDGQGNDSNKVIIKDLPNETWPAITTRSQNWGNNGLNDIDYANSKVKIGMLRNGNEYYWTVNGRLYAYDNSSVYEGIDTMPILVSVDIPCKVTDYYVTTDDAAIEEKLQSDAFSQAFYAGNEDYVEFSQNGSMIFKVTNVLSKDNNFHSIGDKAKVTGNFSIEFDVSDLMINGGKTSFTGMTMNLSRYDNADTVESFMVGKSAVQEDETNKYISRFASWNYQLSMDNSDSIYSYLETSASQFADASTMHHIKVTRTVTDNISYFTMSVDGNVCDFDVKSTTNAAMSSRYTGAYLIWLGGEYTAGSVSNLTFESI